MYLYHITQSCSFLLLHNSLSSSKKTVTHHLPNQITICLFSEFNTIIMHGSEGGIWREENHRRPCFYFSSSPVSHWVESIVGLASSTLKVVAGCISILSDKIQYMGAATVIIVYVIPDWWFHVEGSELTIAFLYAFMEDDGGTLSTFKYLF
ncbi:uncharacterized protein LOC118483174 isoform X1 [Helianthus annuus]|uniref:uncharacterized protein LOC118483174 isoform X1 n=1 Tax=Helianthus annuus TaxID=4232 RepID=UPI001652E481|nr:uncharacterized protein LOC118483174 isoform X1 [Helianthus annuus]